MALSMTGFGIASATFDGFHLKCEVHSVNKKYLDVQMNLPKRFLFLDIPLKKTVESHLRRGKVTVHFDLREHSVSKKVQLNEELFKSWQHEVKQSSEKFGLEGAVQMDTWVQMNELWEVSESEIDHEAYEKSFGELLQTALEGVTKMRTIEGDALTARINSLLGEFEGYYKEIQTMVPEVVENYREKIASKVKESRELAPTEQDIFNRFISVFSDKVDISEELDRLESHINQLKTFLKSDSVVGRKMDFLLQEFHRETNTLATKANHGKISQRGVEMKNLIEQMREQVQNIL